MDHLVFYDPGLPQAVPSPCYVIDLARLENNLQILGEVQAVSGAKILCALKGFALPQAFPLIQRYLAGITASGPHEAMLGREFLTGGEIHVYAVVFSEADLRAVLPIADHLVFNSVAQWRRHREAVAASARPVSCGLRVNPDYSEVEVAIYNPCAPGSRLGVRHEVLAGCDLTGIDGLHFHTMCEQGAGTLERTLAHFEEKFGAFLPAMKWVNFGGGHHITSPVYDRDHLLRIIREFRDRWPHLEVYLEPGEAVAINTGVLVATVLDVVQTSAGPVANLDISATCHMPDVLEMPYRPEVVGASHPDERAWNCRLGGRSCLAGDMIGEYSFDQPLQPGDRLVFRDMAHYTMVKTTTFNGIAHPAIATWDPRVGELTVVREFGYEDYRNRLG